MRVGKNAVRVPELYHCYRCGNVWRPRKAVVRTCPLCKSRLWDTPRSPVVPPFDPENRAWRSIVGPHRELILSAARNHRARNVRVFGSVRRGDAHRGSDLDLLVTFDKGASLLDQIGLKQDLERRLRRRVDVVGDDSINWYLEPQILAEAIPL
jgi:uncharacterized protein